MEEVENPNIIISKFFWISIGLWIIWTALAYLRVIPFEYESLISAILGIIIFLIPYLPAYAYLIHKMYSRPMYKSLLLSLPLYLLMFMVNSGIQRSIYSIQNPNGWALEVLIFNAIAFVLYFVITVFYMVYAVRKRTKTMMPANN